MSTPLEGLLNDGTSQESLMNETNLWEQEIRKQSISSALGCISHSMLGPRSPGKLTVKIAWAFPDRMHSISPSSEYTGLPQLPLPFRATAAALAFSALHHSQICLGLSILRLLVFQHLSGSVFDARLVPIFGSDSKSVPS